MKTVILSIEGMTCSACSSGLEKFLSKQNGIYDANVNLVLATANVTYDENIIDIEKIEKYVSKAGFKSLGKFKDSDLEKNTKRRNIFFVGITILEIFMLYISISGMIKLPTISFFDKNVNPLNYITICIAFSVIFFIYGFDILKQGYNNLIHKTPNMDTLVMIGTVSSFIYSIYSCYMYLNGNIEYINSLYFESVTTVIYIIKLGRKIEGAGIEKTKEAIKKLVTITPKQATITRKNVEKIVSLDEIKKGDIVICKPGEKVAVDGKIISGKAHLDESFITGESKPVKKNIGDNVIAGSINYDGVISYEACKIGRDSTISQIVKIVVEASNSKPKIARIADNVAGIFSFLLIVIAIIIFIVNIIIGNSFEISITTFVTVLLVACPCGMGLAAPLAIIVSESVCLTNGIIVKRGSILESIKEADDIVFDKTGTLTYGKINVEKIFNYSKMPDEELLDIIANIENNSFHPISNAFKAYNKIKRTITEYNEISGMGIACKVDDSDYLIGNEKLILKYGIKNEHKENEEMLLNNGSTVIYVVKDKNIISQIGVNDVIRKEAKNVIETLKKNDINSIMLTGDKSKVANIIAKKLNIENVVADMEPNDKINYISNLIKEGRFVIMCGDGINDSPALTKANVGISIKSATDIAKDSSDVILINNDLKSILNLIKISKNTEKTIKQNLFWAFIYNVVMIPIAMGFFRNMGISITPMYASFAMVLSSLCVVLNSLRLKRVKLYK